jgi:thiol-disulfide isomerase/thioredoxin
MNKKLIYILPVLVILMLGAFIYNAAVNTTLSKGDMAPEISMASTDGTVLTLSSLKGKYVIVDFWASWCGACRKENQNLVRTYNKYKVAKLKDNAGFTILSVSLDADDVLWKRAISYDKLAWPNHVSDLKKWDNQAAIDYGVTSLPTSFLVDPQGKIIASGNSVTEIETELEKLLVQ